MNLLTHEPQQSLIIDLDLFVIISIVISIFILIITHGFWLRKYHEKFNFLDPNKKFFRLFIILGVNQLIIIFGFFVCVLILISEHTLNLYYLIGFFTVGWGNMIYIYEWKTPLIFRKSFLPYIKNKFAK